MTDKEMMLRRMRAAKFRRNNGAVLKAINLIHLGFKKLIDIKLAVTDSAIYNMSEAEFLDSVNFLSEEKYIELRVISSKEDARIADYDYRNLETTVSRKGIRLLAGEFSDKQIDLNE